MARICSVCDKRPQVGHNVSKANNKTKRWLYPNVHVMRYRMPSSKDPRKVYRGPICTKCQKAGKIEKVI